MNLKNRHSLCLRRSIRSSEHPMLVQLSILCVTAPCIGLMIWFYTPDYGDHRCHNLGRREKRDSWCGNFWLNEIFLLISKDLTLIEKQVVVYIRFKPVSNGIQAVSDDLTVRRVRNKTCTGPLGSMHGPAGYLIDMGATGSEMTRLPSSTEIMQAVKSASL